MKKIIKIIRNIFIVILSLLVLAIVIYIGYEVFGAVYNDISAEKQTKELVKCIEKTDAQIIDKYTFTGNTSGTGNHTDMLSMVVVKTEDIDMVSSKIENFEENILSLEYLLEDKYLWPDLKRHLNKMDIPDDTENCYVINVIDSAPFSDSIVGH